jgi:hypothetical protein
MILLKGESEECVLLSACAAERSVHSCCGGGDMMPDRVRSNRSPIPLALLLVLMSKDHGANLLASH